MYRKVSKGLWTISGQFGTRHAGSQGNKCDGIDAVLQVDEAAEMTGNIANDGRAAADEGDRNDKCDVSVVNSLTRMAKLEYVQCLKDHL
jgi:hypothetical protein